jgi:recombination protein RecT
MAKKSNKGNGSANPPAKRNTTQAKVAKVRDLLNDPRVKAQIQMALPRNMDVDRLTRITMTTLQLSPKLLECDAVSLVSAVMQCAQLGLEPDNVLGHAYLVPFKNRVQIILGYRGIMRLARNSDQVLSIEAREVYNGDEFTFRYGDDGARYLRHIPTEKGDPGKLRAAYAVARFKGGGEVWEVVLPRHITKAKRSARGAGKADSPWKLHEGEMWRKTAVRRLEPFLPLDASARRAFAIDEAGESGSVQYIDLDVASDDDTAESGLDALASEAEQGQDGTGSLPGVE